MYKAKIPGHFPFRDFFLQGLHFFGKRRSEVPLSLHCSCCAANNGKPLLHALASALVKTSVFFQNQYFFYNKSASFFTDSGLVAQLVAILTTVCVSSYFSQKPKLTSFFNSSSLEFSRTMKI